MAITLAGNLITLTGSGANPAGGTSWANAYDMEDVLTACGGVVSKQGANAYDISARLRFSSGVYFISKDEFVELKPNPTNPSYTILQDAGTHIRFGEYNSGDKYSYNGAFWRIYVNANSGNQTNRFNGELLIYGSNIWTDTGSYPKGLHFVAGAKIRLYSSIHEHPSYFWAEDCDVQDVKWLGTGGSYDMLVASAPDFNWGKLTTMGCQKGIFFSSTTTGSVDVYDFAPLNAGTDVYVSTGIGSDHLIRIINSPLAITCSNPGAGKQGVQFCYTFNVKVTNSDGDGIIGATVSLKDVDGNNAFTPVDTIAGGVLPNDEIVKWYWFRNAADGGNKDYNDFTLKVVKCADEVEYKIKIDHQIKEDIVLIPSPTASYDNIMTAITDIKGTGFVKDTDSLVNIRPETGKIQSVKTETDKIQTGIIDDKDSFKDKNTEQEIKTAIDNYANKNTYKATGFAEPNEYDSDFTTIETYLKRTLGLNQENYRLFDLVYDDDDNLLSTTIKIYPTASDCNNDTNVLAEYTLTATYTDEKLDSYKVVKV